jgi:hypothetical protein
MRVRSVLCTLFITGCSASLDIPDGTTIACATTADCPAPRVCAVDLGICISAGESAERPAVVGAADVSPILIGAATTTDITFIANKQLGSAIVTIVWPTGESENATSAGIDDATHTYHYQFTPTAGKTLEGSASLNIELHDISGRIAYYTHPTPLTFDFVPPTITPVSVTYQATGLRSDLSAATVGTAIVVTFTSSEALGGATQVSAGDLIFAVAGDAPTLHSYAATIAGGATEGSPTVVVNAYDLAGNLTTTDIGTAVVDTTAAAQPATDVAGKILFSRIPWGSSATRLTPSFTATGQAASVAPSTLVQLLDGNSATANVIGQGSSAADGSFGPIALIGDYPNLWIRTVDSAGNSSPIVSVREGAWTATFNQTDQRGLTLFNPNAARIYPQAGAGRQPQQTEALSAMQIQALANPSDIVTGRYKRVWTEHTLSPPAPRFFHAAAYDPVRDSLLLFGGSSGSDTSSRLNDTWTWDGVQYQQRATTGTAPSARWGHQMTYDAVRNSILLFGGSTATGPSADTWAWDGENWLKLEPDSDIPPARFLHALTTDPVNNNVVLFGGCADKDCTILLNDTWVWDGINWSEVTPAIGPSARAGTAMAYNAGRGGIVLHDGCNENNNIVLGFSLTCDHEGDPDPDTWLWNGSTWANITAPTEPTMRAFHRVVTAPSGALLVLGGCAFNQADYDSESTSCSATGDVWCRGPTNWISIPVSGPGQLYPASAGDRTRTGVVMHGGFAQSLGNFDANSLITVINADCSTGTSSQLVPDPAQVPAPPTGKEGGTLVYVPSSAQSLLYGGGTYFETEPTWLWLGTYWLQASDSSKPPSRQFFGSAMDTVRNKAVIFGGFAGSALLETWELTPGSYQTWAQVCTTAGCRNSIPARGLHAMTTGSGGRPVVFGGGTSNSGGSNLSDLWTYSGTLWTPLCTTCSPRPSARRCSAITYDAVRAKLVLFGGTTDTVGDCRGATNLLNDTWEWDGSKWAQVCTTNCTPPAGRVGHNLVYDTIRARTVLIGGTEDDTINEWDGTQWRTTGTNGPVPLTRHSQAATFEPPRDQVLMYGGWDATGNPGSDTWFLDMTANSSVGIGIDFAYGFANVGAKQPDQLTIHATAGGLGYTLDTTLGSDNDVIGDVQPGAAIEIWNWSTSTWTRVATNTADTSALGDLSFTDTNPMNVKHYISGVPGTIYARIVNAVTNGNGPQPASVAVDYVEATVHYSGP